MTTFDPLAFWLDPEASDQAPEVKAMCKPEYYLDLHNVTQLVVSTLRKYVMRHEWILELGCGTGRNLAGLSAAGYRYLSGVEINSHAIELGRDRWPELRHTPIFCMQIETMMDALDADCIFTQGVLMHLPPASEWVFPIIATNARRVIMTIENEAYENDRTWARNYGEIFTALGWREMLAHSCEAYPPLPEETMLRVFVKEPK